MRVPKIVSGLCHLDVWVSVSHLSREESKTRQVVGYWEHTSEFPGKLFSNDIGPGTTSVGHHQGEPLRVVREHGAVSAGGQLSYVTGQ